MMPLNGSRPNIWKRYGTYNLRISTGSINAEVRNLYENMRTFGSLTDLRGLPCGLEVDSD